MQFVIIAQDGTDADAGTRRAHARAAHLAYTEQHKPHLVMGVATLDSAAQMNGSVMIADFPSRTELDAWLANEPYVIGNVWQQITITPCRIGPSFTK